MRSVVLVAVVVVAIIVIFSTVAVVFLQNHSTTTISSNRTTTTSGTATGPSSIETTTGTLVSSVTTTEQISDVPYCTIGGMSELLDVYIPGGLEGNGPNSTAPLVMYVHGGGWVEGNKGQDWNGIFGMLLASGFVVASVNYYLAPASAPPYGFPINIEDVACALRFLRSNSAQYHIDPNHVGLLGDSAGGNLVSLLALASMNGTFDNVGGYASESDQVQAVVDAFGPANITDPSMLDNPNLTHWGAQSLNLFKVVFANNLTNMELASPVNYVKPGAPIFLIEQGMNDTTVPMIQSIQLTNALHNAGDQAQLILVQNAGHEFVPKDSSLPLSPSLQDLLTDIVSFFNSSLK